MKFELEAFHRNIPDQDLLDDLVRVATKLGRNDLTFRDYNEAGKYTAGTITTRFGTWNNALVTAGLNVAMQKNISDKELFENLEQVWITFGKQPRYRDMYSNASKYSPSAYVGKFGTWRKALEAFVAFINSEVEEVVEESSAQQKTSNQPDEIVFKHKTKRNPSERLKVQVLMRDGNKCRLCGVTLTGNDIHFDHVLAWAKGGETTLENLQVLCKKHNLAKGNV